MRTHAHTKRLKMQVFEPFLRLHWYWLSVFLLLEQFDPDLISQCGSHPSQVAHTLYTPYQTLRGNVQLSMQTSGSFSFPAPTLSLSCFLFPFLFFCALISPFCILQVSDFVSLLWSVSSLSFLLYLHPSYPPTVCSMT